VIVVLSSSAWAAASDVCGVRLTAVSQDWDAAGFAAPVKPVQAVVHGNHGASMSGSEVTYLRSQLRFAVANCAHGHADDAAVNLDRISAALGSKHGAAE
jgi:hypothetical protein